MMRRVVTRRFLESQGWWNPDMMIVMKNISEFLTKILLESRLRRSQTVIDWTVSKHYSVLIEKSILLIWVVPRKFSLSSLTGMKGFFIYLFFYIRLKKQITMRRCEEYFRLNNETSSLDSRLFKGFVGTA